MPRRKIAAKASSASTAIRRIVSGGLRPINGQASHGVIGSHLCPPIPIDGIDCTKWSIVKIERFFQARYSWLSPASLKNMAEIAIKDGRIEGQEAASVRRLRSEIAIKKGRNEVGSNLHLFSKKLKSTISASEVKAVLKRANPKAAGKHLRTNVNDVVTGRTTLAQAIRQVRMLKT